MFSIKNKIILSCIYCTKIKYIISSLVTEPDINKTSLACKINLTNLSQKDNLIYYCQMEL